MFHKCINEAERIHIFHLFQGFCPNYVLNVYNLKEKKRNITFTLFYSLYFVEKILSNLLNMENIYYFYLTSLTIC